MIAIIAIAVPQLVLGVSAGHYKSSILFGCLSPYIAPLGVTVTVNP